MTDDERRSSIPETAINGSFGGVRAFPFPLCSSAKMLSSSEVFHLSPNFDASSISRLFIDF
jgi:hypothetical protein